MRYVQTNSGTFIRHILNEFESLRWDETNKTSVRKLPEAKREQFGVSRLQMVTPPAFDIATQARTEGDAVLVGAVWTQNWIVTDLVGNDLGSAQAAAAISDYNREVSAITSVYSQQEIDSWPTQEAEALAYTASSEAKTPLIDARVAVTLEDKALFVASILTKAELYKVAFGAALGRKKKAQNDNA